MTCGVSIIQGGQIEILGTFIGAELGITTQMGLYVLRMFMVLDKIRMDISKAGLEAL